MAKSVLDTVLSKLKTDYKDSFPKVNEAGVVHRLVLSSPKLNFIFGGGFPLGRISEFYGSESSGKSVVSSYLGGQFQKRTDNDKKVVVYVDMEYSFDKHYATVAGLDCTPHDEGGSFILVQPRHGEQAFTIMETLIKTGLVGLIIYDSTTTTPTSAAMEDAYGKRSFGGGGMLFSEGLKKLNPYISGFQTSVILLTQMRAKVGFQSYGPPDTPSGGGYAPRFYASWRARFSKGEEIKDKDEIIGNKINIKNSKSKIGFPKRGAELELFYGSGFSSDAEYIDFIIDLGLVKKGGAWFSQEQWGLKVQGRDALLKFLQSHKDIFEDCKKQVNDTFSKRTILDTMHISEESEEEDYDIKDHVEENQD